MKNTYKYKELSDSDHVKFAAELVSVGPVNSPEKAKQYREVYIKWHPGFVFELSR